MIDIILDRVFPIGSTYFNKTDSRNPNVILGFGTWVELGGVVLAGKKTGDDTFANTGTIGAKTYTLTVAQMPQHNHPLTMRESADLTNWNPYPPFTGPRDGTVTSNSSGIASAGGGQAHPNIQPTLIGYMWERTA